MWQIFFSDRHFAPRQNTPQHFTRISQRWHVAPNPKFWWTFCSNFFYLSWAHLGHVLGNTQYGIWPWAGRRKRNNSPSPSKLSLSALSLSAVFCDFENLCSLLFLPDEWKHESSASNKQYVASCLAFSC